MKNSEAIIQTGTEGQRFEVRAHVEHTGNPHAPGVNLKFTSTFENTRNPGEQRVLFQQYFPNRHEFDSFVSFLVNQRVKLG